MRIDEKRLSLFFHVFVFMFGLRVRYIISTVNCVRPTFCNFKCPPTFALVSFWTRILFLQPYGSCGGQEHKLLCSLLILIQKESTYRFNRNRLIDSSSFNTFTIFQTIFNRTSANDGRASFRRRHHINLVAFLLLMYVESSHKPTIKIFSTEHTPHSSSPISSHQTYRSSPCRFISCSTFSCRRKLAARANTAREMGPFHSVQMNQVTLSAACVYLCNYVSMQIHSNQSSSMLTSFLWIMAFRFSFNHACT